MKILSHLSALVKYFHKLLTINVQSWKHPGIKDTPTDIGFQFVSRYESQNPCCVTAVFGSDQVLVASKADARYVAAYVNWATCLNRISDKWWWSHLLREEWSNKTTGFSAFIWIFSLISAGTVTPPPGARTGYHHPAKSTIVRASFNTLWHPHANSFNWLIACPTRLSPVSSNWQNWTLPPHACQNYLQYPTLWSEPAAVLSPPALVLVLMPMVRPDNHCSVSHKLPRGTQREYLSYQAKGQILVSDIWLLPSEHKYKTLGRFRNNRKSRVTQKNKHLDHFFFVIWWGKSRSIVYTVS